MITDIRKQIETSLAAFGREDLKTASINLLNTLGYQSDKSLDYDGSPKSFLEQFNQNQEETNFSQEKALVEEWDKIHLLFQLTDSELAGQTELFNDNSVNQGLMQSYMFFAVKLSGTDYARGKLAGITRQLNRLFPMPVMVFFEYNQKLTIAVINRRRNKRDADKDVLGKVTLIQDISLNAPHRGHLDIMASFALDEISSKNTINNFDALHTAWEEIFNVELLNEKFYREISNWYFWAMQEVHFPYDQLRYDKSQMDKEDLFKDETVLREHDAKNLIRLLTRLLFVWFIKEKGLVPEKLFNKESLQNELLDKFDADSGNTLYYKAILQNLFFATLNQTRGKREFRKDGQHQNTTTLMRYEESFRNTETFINLLESVVPFMNGGLFECLDKPHPTLKGRQGGAKILYEDGFSDRKDNTLKVPDYLFFGEEKTIDLSGTYGDKKRKKEKTRGIISILNSYKFTIVENTPIEQEIALDPELLGKVFENLLASYNPETKTTARNQTGSFYTQRTIVDYMVDESLKAYFKTKLLAANYIDDEIMTEALDRLFGYNEKDNPFLQNEVIEVLIKAIDECKILDPACGSGAFPMGILHKLEFILGKLDQNNKLWRDRQIEKVDTTIAAAENIDDATIRENSIQELEAQKLDIAESFANNELGYGRKLYLIENCIYGVDIQSIAIQVSKLRFFISLIVDQKVTPEKDNFGIRPLPNLEIKFATANTLIQIEKPPAQAELFDSANVKTLEAELKRVRHNLFNAKTPKTKNKHRQRDKELREQIAIELEVNGWSNTSARQLAGWDPYDQNASSPFFDPEWMFDLKGFDIVIGNPPYVQIQNFSGQACQKQWQEQGFKTFAKTGDIYCLFYERGYELLCQDGVLSYITSNKWMRAGYGKAMRQFFLENGQINQLIDFGDSPVFKAATTYTNILLWSKTKKSERPAVYDLNAVYANNATLEEMLTSAGADEPLFSEHSFVIAGKDQAFIKKRVEQIGTPLKDWDVSINRGILTGCNEAFIISASQKDELIAQDPKSAEIIKPILRGRDIKRYQEHFADLWLINAHNDYTDSDGIRIPRIDVPSDYPAIWAYLQKINNDLDGRLESRSDQGAHWTNLRNCAYLEEFRKEKISWGNLSQNARFAFVDTDVFINAPSPLITPASKYLLAVLNSKLGDYYIQSVCVCRNGGFYEYKPMFVQQLPIPRIDPVAQKPFETLVNYVLFASANEMEFEAKQVEDVIDGLVYDLYFEEEMKKAHCRITDRITEIIKPFTEEDTDEFKAEYIKKLCEFFRKDKVVFHCLIHRRNINAVKIINGNK